MAFDSVQTLNTVIAVPAPLIKLISLLFDPKGIIKKYSNFVGSPIKLNGIKVNDIQPVWLLDPKKVGVDEHIQFYRFISNSYDSPRFTLHYKVNWCRTLISDEHVYKPLKSFGSRRTCRSAFERYFTSPRASLACLNCRAIRKLA